MISRKDWLKTGDFPPNDQLMDTTNKPVIKGNPILNKLSLTAKLLLLKSTKFGDGVIMCMRSPKGTIYRMKTAETYSPANGTRYYAEFDDAIKDLEAVANDNEA